MRLNEVRRLRLESGRTHPLEKEKETPEMQIRKEKATNLLEP